MDLTGEDARQQRLLLWLLSKGPGMLYDVSPFYGQLEHGFQLAQGDLRRLRGQGFITFYVEGGGVPSAQLTSEGRSRAERLRGDRDLELAARLANAEELLRTARDALAAAQGTGAEWVPGSVKDTIAKIDAYVAGEG